MPLFLLFAILSTLLCGAIFGFFYAWVCSTMWGLDAADPRVAIQAMQAMNASVRNGVFAPAFFGTPIALLITAGLAFALGKRGSGLAFAAAGLVYFFGGFLLTVLVHIPMNEALALIEVPDNVEEAHQIWQSYSPRWQVFNILRTMACAVSLGLCSLAIILIAKDRKKLFVE